MALAGQSRYLEISMLNTSSRQGSEPTLVTLSAAKGLVWGAHGVSIKKRTCCLSPLSAAKGKGLATAAQRSFAALRACPRAKRRDDSQDTSQVRSRGSLISKYLGTKGHSSIPCKL